MAEFKILHAADLHLDSPLLGLATKSPEYAARIQQASRQAFDDLVALAIEEGCRFVILAGDVFDDDLRDFQTGLFFLSRMRLLQDAGVEVFMIAGNHDAVNRFASKLVLSENVHLLDRRKPETRVLDDVDVAIHGRSFWQRDVTDNIARDYPAPHAGRFNIGVLHTACQGREGGHAPYAPCTLEQLVNHGYDYWALGHVHARDVMNTHPHVVYPGNLQGRHARESGPKGATLVTVADGRILSAEHRDLDIVRWANETIDVTGRTERSDILHGIRTVLEDICADAGGRPLAVRLRLSGQTPQHAALLIDQSGFREEVEALLATLPSEVWLEKLVPATSAPSTPSPLDPTIAGRLELEITEFGESPTLLAFLDERLKEIRNKMPAGARVDELFEQIRAQAPHRAVDLALCLIEEPEASLAPR